jgi:hypothetical protein
MTQAGLKFCPFFKQQPAFDVDIAGATFLKKADQTNSG